MGGPLRSEVREHRAGLTFLSRQEIPTALYESLVKLADEHRQRLRDQLPPGQLARVSLADVVRVLLTRGVQQGLGP